MQEGVYVKVGNRIIKGVPIVNEAVVIIGVATTILVRAHEFIVTVNGTIRGATIG